MHTLVHNSYMSIPLFIGENEVYTIQYRSYYKVYCVGVLSAKRCSRFSLQPLQPCMVIPDYYACFDTNKKQYLQHISTPCGLITWIVRKHNNTMWCVAWTDQSVQAIVTVWGSVHWHVYCLSPDGTNSKHRSKPRKVKKVCIVLVIDTLFPLMLTMTVQQCVNTVYSALCTLPFAIANL